MSSNEQIETLLTENKRLKKLVKFSYEEGYEDGQYDNAVVYPKFTAEQKKKITLEDSIRGGWNQSRTYKIISSNETFHLDALDDVE